MNHFWDISLANIITWLLIVVGFVGAQYVQTKLLMQRMNGFAKWVEKHEGEAHDRAILLTKLGETSVRLTVLAEAAERRLEKLEDGERRTYTRRSDPPPYFGPERRGK